MTILWLHHKSYSSNLRHLIEKYIKAVDLNPAKITYLSLHHKVPGMWTRKAKTKNKWVCDFSKSSKVYEQLDEWIKMFNPKIIVINDTSTLGFILKQASPSMYNCRASVYSYKGIPAIVINTVGAKGQPLVKMVRHGPWELVNDLKKVKRWYENNKRGEPRFRYSVARSRENLETIRQSSSDSLLISTDIETVGNNISCVGFSFLTTSGIVDSYVVPFIHPLREDNCYWQNDEEHKLAWTVVKEVLESSVPKVMQGGGYDCAYFIRANICVTNYIYDTMHLFHSIWAEAPKKLNYIASIVLDHCRFWKDEKKGDKDERIPHTESGLERYWRYNGLDCHNTLLACLWLVKQITKPQLAWALANYNTEFRSEVGPALYMSMTGTKVDNDRKTAKNIEWMEKYQKNLRELRIMTDTPEFNPNSNDQVAQLIYDVLGAKNITSRGKKKYGDRSVDEKILKFIRIQHPLFAIFIDKIWETKKPANNSSKYGQMRLLNGRFMYRYGAAGTKFGRYNGKEHQYWIGTNPQNIPAEARDMLVADNGYVMVDADYSQSDNYFIAYECEDEKMIATLNDERDTHCIHAEFFFKKPYDEIYKGYKEKAEWVVHSTKGVRQNTKRIVYGASYQMMAFTLYMTMGHEAVVGTAQALGHEDAHLWPRGRLLQLCEELLRAYYHLYPRLPTWFQETAQECVKNGNLATCAYGLTHLFFGDVSENKDIQREISSFYGQGGTSGNINRTLNHIYYKTDLIQQGLIILLQTHDSITFQVPEKRLDLAEKFLTIMEQPCTIKGRTFTVPVEADIGYSWKKGMISWRPDVKLEEIKEAERKFAEKTYGINRRAA